MNILPIKKLTLLLQGIPCGYHYVCKVRINGKSLTMIVDTGASSSLIDEKVFGTLNNKLPAVNLTGHHAQGGGGSIYYECSLLNSLVFNNIKFKDYSIGVSDLNNFLGIYKAYGVDEVVHGILGMDILMFTNSVLDFKRSIIKSSAPSKATIKQLKEQRDKAKPVLEEYSKNLKVEFEGSLLEIPNEVIEPDITIPPIEINFSSKQ